MNNVTSFLDRQYGFNNNQNYDFIFQRLHAHEKDNWKGIIPSDYGVDFNPNPPIFSAKFCNVDSYKHILAIANEDGKIAIQDTNKRNEEVGEVSLEGQQCHHNAVFDLEWMPDNMKFVSASGDHTARLWDITESQCVLSRIFNGHSRSVKTATFRRKDPAVFATGGRDGAILIWDSRAVSNIDLIPKADNCIYSGHSGGPGTPQNFKKKTRNTPKLPSHVSSSSITGLAFQDDHTLVSCGAGDGVIKIWDLRRNYSCYKKEPQPKHSFPYPGSSTFKGFTNLIIDNAGLRLYVNCMDNNIYAYNLSSNSKEPLMRYTGHKNTTFYIKSCLSPDDKYIVSGSSDEKAYIWNVQHPQPIVALTGHTVEVTCAAWSHTSDLRIVTCSDDARHKIWKIAPEFISDDEMMKYKGVAEENKDYEGANKSKKIRLRHLEYTPRSIKRLIDVNERTPTCTEKNKRTLKDMMDDMDDDDGMNSKAWDAGHVLKRQNTETRGRRLFAPLVASTSSTSQITLLNNNNNNKPLITIPEELMKDDNETSPITPAARPIISGRLVSPLTEKLNINLRRSPTETQHPETSGYSSPTSNLPNYAIDGEAPHLRITSPKRKLKENVDWLTKIRKQKLLSSASTAKCQLISASDKIREDADFHDVTMMSPRVQCLKAEESSPRSYSTPKRRSSRSGSHSEAGCHAKTPNSARRGSTESILKFFTVTTQSSGGK